MLKQIAQKAVLEDKDLAHMLIHMAVIADGCLEHPEYRVNSIPRSGCKTCDYLWRLKLELVFREDDAPKTLKESEVL